jgi:hypothetical protein
LDLDFGCVEEKCEKAMSTKVSVKAKQLPLRIDNKNGSDENHNVDSTLKTFF